jgi:hypothetical protein
MCCTYEIWKETFQERFMGGVKGSTEHKSLGLSDDGTAALSRSHFKT